MTSPLANQFVDDDGDDVADNDGAPPTHAARATNSTASGLLPKTPMVIRSAGAAVTTAPPTVGGGAIGSVARPNRAAPTPLSTSKTPQGLAAATTAAAVVNGVCSLAQLSTPRIRKLRHGPLLGCVSPGASAGQGERESTRFLSRSCPLPERCAGRGAITGLYTFSVGPGQVSHLLLQLRAFIHHRRLPVTPAPVSSRC